MATNPNNAVGTNGAFGGRTSVNAFNDVLSIFNGRGIVQGWDMAPNEGMIINIGGDGTTRDVAVAEDNIGNKTTINNISEEPIALTIPAAPAASSRIDAVVAYVDNPAQGSATETDNPAACGLIVVEGTVTTTPTAPDEEAIRTAITADGGAGTVAYYVVLGTVTVASGTTDISANMLTKGGYAAVKSDNVDSATWHTFDVTTASGVGIVENHSAYSTELGLCFVSFALTLTNGMPVTPLSGLPKPLLNTSQRLNGTTEPNSVAIGPWVRGNGTVGSGTRPSATSVGFSGLYPISLDDLPASTGEYKV